MICSKCGSNIPDDSKFCVRCGSKIEKDVAQVSNVPGTKICPGCGSELRLEAKFCAKCGMKQEVQPAVQPIPKPTPQHEVQPASQPFIQVAPQPASQQTLKEPPKKERKSAMKSKRKESSQTDVQVASQPFIQVASQPVIQPASQPTPQSAPQADVQAASQPFIQVAPQPVVQSTSRSDSSGKKGGMKAVVVIAVILLVIGLVCGGGYVLVNVFDVHPIAAIAGLFGDKAKETKEEENSDETEKTVDKAGEKESKEDKETSETTIDAAALLEPADELAAQTQTEYENGNYFAGVIPQGAEAMAQYVSIGEEYGLKEEAQNGINSVYDMYADAVIRTCDGLRQQGANAACLEQIRITLTDGTDLVDMIKEKGYTVEGEDLYAYKAETIQWYRNNFIQCINNITKYENWSRDEAWSYAEQAAYVKENAKPFLFDDEDLDDPLRMRYVYCLAWKTRKVCENGLADGTMTKENAAQSMIAILQETDYNMLLIQDIITYGSEAGMDVEKYRQAYDAIVDEIRSEQGLTIGNSTGVNSASSVDLQHFWYFNDLDGEDVYKVDLHNGTTAATREWIRSNVPVILNE